MQGSDEGNPEFTGCLRGRDWCMVYLGEPIPCSCSLGGPLYLEAPASWGVRVPRGVPVHLNKSEPFVPCSHLRRHNLDLDQCRYLRDRDPLFRCKLPDPDRPKQSMTPSLKDSDRVESERLGSCGVRTTRIRVESVSPSPAKNHEPTTQHYRVYSGFTARGDTLSVDRGCVEGVFGDGGSPRYRTP